MENKIKSREVLARTSYVPQFIEIDSSSTIDDETITSYLPAVVKCPTSTGSKDVLKISNLDDYKQKSEMLFSKYPMILLF